MHQLVGSWKGTGSTDRILPWNRSSMHLGLPREDGRVSLNFFAGEASCCARPAHFNSDDGTFHLTIENPKKELLRFAASRRAARPSYWTQQDVDAKDGLDRVELKVLPSWRQAVVRLQKETRKSVLENVATLSCSATAGGCFGREIQGRPVLRHHRRAGRLQLTTATAPSTSLAKPARKSFSPIPIAMPENSGQ